VHAAERIAVLVAARCGKPGVGQGATHPV
jgi:hypothetical protein